MSPRPGARPLALFVLLAMMAGAAPALARPGGWSARGWDSSPGWSRGPATPPNRYDTARGGFDRSNAHYGNEGRVSAERFVTEGDAAAALGHGAITIAPAAEDGDTVGPGNRAAYEAAVIDRLVHAGYDTAQARPEDGQVAELRVLRIQLQPAEAPRKPVSGEAMMGVSNRGPAYGLAVNVDLTKPLPPLVSTRLEARIRDKATGTVLWEGRAQVATREGDAQWSEQTIAARLAEALFDGFPKAPPAGHG